MFNKKTVYQDKFRAANNLDEIALASTNYVNEDLKHVRKDNFKEFARGDVFIKVGGNDYSAKVIIGFTNRNDMVLYDIIGFTPTAFDMKKKNSQPVITQNESLERSGSSVEQSISNDKISVNTNSMQNQQNNSKERFSLSAKLDSSGNSLSEEQQKYFSGSSLIDDKGRLLKLWHATKGTHTIFDNNKSHYDRKVFFSTDPIEILDINDEDYYWSEDGELMYGSESIDKIHSGEVDSFSLNGYNVASYYVNAKKTFKDLSDAERTNLTEYLEESYPDIDTEEFIEMIDAYNYEERESELNDTPFLTGCSTLNNLTAAYAEA